MQQNNFLLLKKSKNIESAQLRLGVTRSADQSWESVLKIRQTFFSGRARGEN